MSKIGSKGGMSLTTGFDVKFDFGPRSKMPQRFYFNGDDDLVHMLCDEAQLLMYNLLLLRYQEDIWEKLPCNILLQGCILM